MNLLTSTIYSISLFSLTTLSYASDIQNGAKLHEGQCTQCHSSETYTHSNRKVKDLPSLGGQVRFCKNKLGITWFDEEVNDVVGYLNKKHYKF